VPCLDLSPLYHLKRLRELEIPIGRVNLEQVYSLPLLQKFTPIFSDLEEEQIEKLQSDFPSYTISMPPLQLKEGHHYEVVQSLQMGTTLLPQGTLVAFLGSTLNPYEGIVNCQFVILDKNEKLNWSYNNMRDISIRSLFKPIR
jgi:hypothetical protein